MSETSIEVKALDTSTRSHHPDSPSSLQASEACALFENESRESQASQDGVLQHKAAETRDLTILEGNEAWVGAVDRCIELEDREIEYLVENTAVGDRVEQRRPTVTREKYLHVGTDIVKDSNGVDWVGVTGGFPDTLILSPDKRYAVIIDFKFGKVPVTPTKDNLQGMAYALATFEAYPTLGAVKVVFFAPHQMWDEETQEKKYTHEFLRGDMPAMELRIRTVVARKIGAKQDLETKGDWSAATPKTSLCVFCGLKGRCPKNLALTIRASSKHELATVPQEFGVMEISTPEHVAAAYKAVNHLEPILKAIKKRCVELALTQDIIPEGWKIVRRQDREITSLDSLIEAAKRHGIKKKDLEALFTLPISKVEEAVKAKAEKGLGAAAVRGFGATLEELGAVKLGPASHFLKECLTPAEKPNVEPAALDAPINI